MKIVVDHISGSRQGQRQEFRSATRLRFGRHPDNDVSFDAHRDLDASSRHAELRRKGRSYVLHDVGSSNGTFSEGRRVAELALEKGSATEVEFGAGGPRLRIWIGGLDEEPVAPLADGSRALPEMIREAARDARIRGGGLAGAGAFARSLSAQLVRRSSWRLRIGLLAILVAVLVGAAALIWWRVSLRERAEVWKNPETALCLAGECAKLQGSGSMSTGRSKARRAG